MNTVYTGLKWVKISVLPGLNTYIKSQSTRSSKIYVHKSEAEPPLTAWQRFQCIRRRFPRVAAFGGFFAAVAGLSRSEEAVAKREHIDVVHTETASFDYVQRAVLNTHSKLSVVRSQ